MERLTKISKIGEHLPKKSLNLTHKSDSSESNLTEILEKLGEYEDAEEQGLLLRLPCKIDTIVYEISDRCDGDCTTCFAECDTCQNYTYYIDEKTFDYPLIGDIGKTVFLTKEEAETKLKEMEKGNENNGK